VTDAARPTHTPTISSAPAHATAGDPGNRGVYVLRRVKLGRAEFTFISLWESIDAIRRFAGDDYEKAHYYPEDRDFLIELEPFVEHYDVLTGA